jgi:hypothetical protein
MESKGAIAMAEALVVLTGATVWTMKDGSPHPTGFWAREFIEAHDAFTDGGLGVSIATPLGVKPTVEQLSWYRRPASSLTPVFTDGLAGAEP